MKQLFWLPFLLVHLARTGSTQKSESCLLQPKVMWNKIGKKAVLSCMVNSNCTAAHLQFKWFVVKEGSHEHLKLTERHSLNIESLEIKSLNVSDTGIYLCAAEETKGAECCLPFVGEGTALIVGERAKSRHGCNLTFSKKTSKTQTDSLRNKTQFRDVLQELHSRRNLNKRKQRTSGNGTQVEAVSVDVNIPTDDIYQNV
ncbi:uncharacterized protein LOC124864726 isoform X3 [Girardinichthys multiradiatus]|uniref:uncharacterized protein LOC124864726 isoform X3 n=1 Tax=Girardinichthys multiradiatus TaxID=208333 RepID=UPI001FAE4518|nr:uncharacterized protein LOC124864726 isoform X3 [Girardinichthys multiradiatus]